MNNLKTRLLPYYHLSRLDKPVGSLLLFLPSTYSILMSTFSLNLPLSTTLSTSILFLTGSVVMRGAGCTINDMWDKNLDSKVERTKTRPLANNLISIPQASIWLAIQLSTGLLILSQLNSLSIAVGASSLILIATYPLMKRITNWPQLFLGLTFNWGVLLGWTAMTNTISAPLLIPLYLSSVAWTLVYDTIYALQDRKDDREVGIRSTALLFGKDVKRFDDLVASVALLAVAGWVNGQGVVFYLVSCLGAAGHFGWQVWGLDVDDVKGCWDRFLSNVGLGVIVSSGILIDLVIKRYKERNPKKDNQDLLKLLNDIKKIEMKR